MSEYAGQDAWGGQPPPPEAPPGVNVWPGGWEQFAPPGQGGIGAGSVGPGDALTQWQQQYGAEGAATGVGGAAALTELQRAQLRLLELQAEELAQLIASGGATDFDIQQFEEKIRQFNEGMAFNRAQTELEKAQFAQTFGLSERRFGWEQEAERQRFALAERSQGEVERSARMSEFLQGQGLMAGMAPSLIPAGDVGKPLPGFEAGSYLARGAERYGEFTPGVQQGRSIPRALTSLAEGEQLR